MTIAKLQDVEDADCIILAVAHSCFKELPWEALDKLYGDKPLHEKVLIDVKGLRTAQEAKGYQYWRL